MGIFVSSEREKKNKTLTNKTLSFYREGESRLLGRLIRSPGSPRRREKSGIVKEEERTNIFFFSTFLSLSHKKQGFFPFKTRIDDYTANNSV